MIGFTFKEQALYLLKACFENVFEFFVAFVVIGQLVQTSEFMSAVFMDGFACQVVFGFGFRVIDHVQLVLDLG